MLRPPAQKLCLLAVALLAAGIYSAAPARGDDAPEPPQRPRGNMTLNPGIEKLRMLTAEKVQKALDLSDAQRDSLKKIGEDFREESRKAREDSKDLSPEERRAKMAPAIEALQKKLDDVLTDTQRGRIKEIGLQLRGPVAALTQKDVAEALQLTDDQKSKLADLRKDQRQQMRDLFGGGGAGGRPDAGTLDKIKKITKETNDKAKEVLTSEQREKFEKMEGPKIDFDNFDIGIGGRSGFGRGGRGGSDGAGPEKP